MRKAVGMVVVLRRVYGRRWEVFAPVLDRRENSELTFSSTWAPMITPGPLICEIYIDDAKPNEALCTEIWTPAQWLHDRRNK